MSTLFLQRSSRDKDVKLVKIQSGSRSKLSLESIKIRITVCVIHCLRCLWCRPLLIIKRFKNPLSLDHHQDCLHSLITIKLRRPRFGVVLSQVLVYLAAETRATKSYYVWLECAIQIPKMSRIQFWSMTVDHIRTLWRTRWRVVDLKTAVPETTTPIVR